MTTHTYHDPEEAHLILKDDCPRCAEHAEEPWVSLDSDRLAALVEIALSWEDGGEARLPQSAPERRACQQVLNVLASVRAMFGLPTRRDAVVALRRGASSK